MSTIELMKAQETVAGWRTGGLDNPAGPVLGRHAAADITMTALAYSGVCGTACSGSSRHYCC